MSEYVVLAGQGTCSSLNIEALLADYFLKAKRKKRHVVLVIPFETRPSAGQVLAQQVAAEMQIDIVASTKTGDLSQLSSCTVSDEPWHEMIQGSPADIFLLYDDEDEESLEVLSISALLQWPVFDLCRGLLPIAPISPDTPILAPDIPEAEKLPVNAPEALPEDNDEELDEEEDEEDDDEDYEEELTDEQAEIADNLYAALDHFANLVAQKVVQIMKETK